MLKFAEGKEHADCAAVTPIGNVVTQYVHVFIALIIRHSDSFRLNGLKKLPDGFLLGFQRVLKTISSLAFADSIETQVR
jgi:hypothetical protein